MKTIRVFLLFVALLLAPVSFANSDGIREIELQSNQLDGTLLRAPSAVEFDCYLWDSPGIILLSSNQIFENVQVSLCNILTGDYYQEQTSLDSIPIVLYLFGPGYYDLSITMPSGIIYSATFVY